MKTEIPELKLLVNEIKARNEKIRQKQDNRKRNQKVREMFQELNLRLIEK